jgi:hypothetical protein
MALSLSQFKPRPKRPKGMGNPPVIRRDIPLARATFFGPGGPQAPKEKPQAAPTTDFSPKAWV